MPLAARADAFHPPTADDTALAIAKVLLEGFNRHYALFRDCARAAKRYFEAANAPTEGDDESGLTELPPHLYGKLAALALV